jgi:hypothetical protein
MLAFEEGAPDAPTAQVRAGIAHRFPAWDGPALGDDDSAPALAPLRAAAQRYFAGTPDALEKLPVDMGGTPFQRGV